MTDTFDEKAREILAPYFATDGEEESERVAKAVEGLLADIAAALREAAGKERERCAKIAEPKLASGKWVLGNDIANADAFNIRKQIAAAIRTPTGRLRLATP